MALTEEDRLVLRSKLNEVLGKREAAVLMESVPPVHYDQLATKSDLQQQTDLLRGELRVETGELRLEMGELRVEMGELRAELKADIARLDLRMAQQLRVTVLTHVGSMIGLAAFLSALN